MKPKIGICLDCEDNKEKILYASRCKYHYWLNRHKINSQKRHNIEKRNTKRNLSVFFASQFNLIPDHCENCQKSLKELKKINTRALIAHILPKRKMGGFPSVSTHPQNIVYLCFECHSNYDNKGLDFVLKMPALKIMKERFKLFKCLLSSKEIARVPDYLK